MIMPQPQSSKVLLQAPDAIGPIQRY